MLPLMSIASWGAPFVVDNFNGTNGADLNARNGEVGATWARHPASAAVIQIQTNRAYHAAGAFTYPRYYASGIPASAEYDVNAIVQVVSNADQVFDLMGRMDTSATTWYIAQYDNYHGDAPAKWRLIKVVAGSTTVLGTYNQTLTVGQAYTVTLQLRDALKTLLVDGVSRITSADNTITAKGRVGIGVYSDVLGTTSIGYHAESILATDF